MVPLGEALLRRVVDGAQSWLRIFSQILPEHADSPACNIALGNVTGMVSGLCVNGIANDWNEWLR